MSNMSRPTRPGRCTWAIAAARWSAMRWRSLLEAAGFAVTREYYVNDAGSQVDTLARSAHLRYREALGEDIGEIPEGLYPGDYLIPVGASARRRIWRPLRRRARERMARAVQAQDRRGDDRPDPARPRPARHPPRHVRVGSRAAGGGRARARRGDAARQGAGLSRACSKRPKSLDEHRRLGAGRADPVPLDPVRRRPGPADEEVGRQLDLFRRRRRLSSAEGRKRRPSRQHLGRRPCRDGQAHPGGGHRADRRPRRSRRQDRPDGQTAARRRADQDVASARAISSRWPMSSAKSARTSCAS